MKRKNKLKKLKVNLLKESASSENIILSKLSSVLSLLHIDIDEELIKKPEFIIFSLSVLVFLIFGAIDVFLFLSNLRLNLLYKQKELAIKPYEQKMVILNKELFSLKAKYDKLNNKIGSFVYINKIFDNYHNHYKALASIANFVLSDFSKKGIYPSLVSINTNPQDLNPSVLNISIDAQSFKNTSPLASLEYKNGCYEVNIKNLCVKSINEKDTLKVNGFGFAYFKKDFNVLAEFINKDIHKEVKDEVSKKTKK